jgi:hypothetical protein
MVITVVILNNNALRINPHNMAMNKQGLFSPFVQNEYNPVLLFYFNKSNVYHFHALSLIQASISPAARFGLRNTRGYFKTEAVCFLF